MRHFAKDVGRNHSVTNALRTPLRALALGSVAALALATPAHAQSVPPPQTFYPLDPNGVDLVTGHILFQSPSISIGQPGMGGLSYFRTYDSGVRDWRDNVAGTINSSGSLYTVTLKGVSESFTLSGGVYTENDGRGGTLTVASGIYTYTRADGAVALYSTALAGTQPVQANVARVTSLTLPSGEVDTFTYTTLTGPGFSAQRLQSVTNTLGYQLSFTYQSNSADTTGITLTDVTGINNAVEYCAPTANGCTLSGNWPTLAFATVTIAGNTFYQVTDALSRMTQYQIQSSEITRIIWPGSGIANRSFSYSGSVITQVSNGTVAWNYSASTVGTTRTVTVTDPATHSRVYTSNTATNRMTSYRNASLFTTTYGYDAQGRLTRATLPEGNYVNTTYDTRGNVTESRAVAKPGSGLSDIVTTASFDTTCVNPITCNEPNSVTDARGFRTDFTYDASHGGVLTVTQPGASGSAPTGSAPRPQTRYGYTHLFAYYKNSSGTIVAAPTGVYRLTSTSACATTSSCAGGADETVSSIVYGTTGVANNLLPTSSTSGAGDGSLTATTQTAYDSVGNVASVQGPLGSVQTTVFHYDLDRERTGIVGPDPDGGGALLNRALRYTYNGFGLVTKTEQGTVPSQTDTDWNLHFTSIEETDSSFDANGQLIRQDFVSGGTTYNVSQFGYDVRGLLGCQVVRMNPAVFGTLPTTCGLGTEGSNGPDRVTSYVYDDDGRPFLITSANATAQQRIVGVGYTSNGLLASTSYFMPGGNLTNMMTYEYDGFDRLSKTRYPLPTGSGSSTTDYELLGYDANSNVTSDRLRDGTSFANTYDNLDRLTLAHAPGTTPEVAYGYDLFGRLLSAAFTNPGGQRLTYTYDQLSRILSETNSTLSTTVSYQYDLAGDRTRITWPDTLYVQYDYDATGEVSAIRENGATSGAGVLATYTYNDLGQRVTITRGNTVTTTYSYDAAQRLASLAHHLASPGSDQTISYTYNAANQALTHTGTNSAYVYTPPTGYLYGPTNGLDQITSVNRVAASYDARGNLSSDGTTSYTYDAYNRLVGAGAGTLAYDPQGRLDQAVGSTTTQFVYDGAEPIAEYNSTGTMQRRFVPGPDIDEHIAWYEGSGTTDRRWLITDEQNSVIAVADAAGVASNINSYDEYGVPSSGNIGRFQYTGQMWLNEVSLYQYKLRIYSPTIGRFLQTDPIGQTGGLNLYSYGAGDPINLADPLGLSPEDCVPTPIYVSSVQPDAENPCNVPIHPIETPDQIHQNFPGLLPLPSLPNNTMNQDSYFDFLLPYWGATGNIPNEFAPGTFGFMRTQDVIIEPMLRFGVEAGSRLPFTPEELKPYADEPQERVPNQSGAEGATDIPSWARGSVPRANESGRDFATRIMNDHFGEGQWRPTGRQLRDFQQIKKFGDRGFQIPRWIQQEILRFRSGGA